jgi:hypothetical protein
MPIPIPNTPRITHIRTEIEAEYPILFSKKADNQAYRGRIIL